MRGKGKKKEKAEELPADSELTDMQQAFVREYLIDKNGTAAAIRAGYAEKHAASQAYQLLHIPLVQKAISQAIAAQFRRLDLSADRVLHELMLLATVDISEAYDHDGNLLPIKEMPENVRRAIAGVEVDEIWDGFGKDRVQSGETKKLKVFDKNRALELLAKNLKLLTDKIEIDDKTGLAARLSKARKKRKGK